MTQDTNKLLEKGGVELNTGEAKLFSLVLEHVMVISKDKPSLNEALGGNEHEAWYDAINVELTQMEKVNAWVPVIPPHNANIIPSHYVF